MVKKFLKIAGVKNEQEFYNKYPTEEAFFKAHPEAKDLKQYKQGGQQKKLEQLTSYEGDIDNIIPTAQVGKFIPKPTTQDSLNLYNAQIALNNFYNNEVKAGRLQKSSEYPVISPRSPADMKQANLKFYRGEFDYRKEKKKGVYDDVYGSMFGLTPAQVASLEAKGIAMSKSGNEYQAYYRDLITPEQNLASPFALYDSRITPQRDISYRQIKHGYPGGIVDVYDYDPLAIKPYSMRTPQEKIEWNKKYGKGIPEKRTTTSKSKPKPKPKPESKPKPKPSGKIEPKTVTSTPTNIGITERKIETPPMKTPEKKQEKKTNFSITWADPNENPNALTQKTKYFDNYDEFKKAANEMGIQQATENKSKSSASAHLGVRSNVKFKSGGTAKAQVGINLNPPTIPNPNFGTPGYNYMWGTGGGLGSSPVVGGSTPGAISAISNPNVLGGLGSAIGGMANASNTSKALGQSLGKSIGGATSPNPSALDKVLKMAGPAGKIIGGFKALKEEKEVRRGAQQERDVSNIAMQAASTRPEPIKRKYARPEDALVNPNELFPTYGVGTNVLTAEDGAEVSRGDIGGNPTEIQNMYNPYDLYEDLGYEPLDESETIKQYRHGGIHRADFGSMMSGFAGKFGNTGFGKGFGKFNKAGGFDVAENVMGMIPGANNAGGQIGSGIGQAIGSVIPIPGAGKVLGLVGQGVGSILDRQAAKTRRFQNQTQQNITNMGLMSGAQSLQDANAAYMENGGYVSHNWNPQVIAKWGDIDVSDVHNIFTEGMDTLRTGGHITQNKMSPMDQFSFGGQMKTHWGGYGEKISQNPYLPASGETIMFKGQSHEESDGKGRTGIGVSYGDTNEDSYTDYAEYGTDAATDKANVEVERNEPAIELPDESGDNSMVVYGNLKIPNQFLSEIGDPKAKGRKFKNYVAGLSKQEAKHNKTIEKNMNIIQDMDDVTPFDQIKFFSAKANIDGANAKLKKIAGYKVNAAAVQNAINDTAEENGLDADALAKGKFKIDKNAFQEQAKWGKSIPTADGGARTFKTVKKEDFDYLTDLYSKAKAAKRGPAVAKFQSEFHRIAPDVAKAVLKDYPLTKKGKSLGLSNSDLTSNVDEIFGDRTEEYMNYLKKAPMSKMTMIAPKPVTIDDEEDVTGTSTGTSTNKTTNYPVKSYKRSKLIDAANEILPYIRPTNQTPLDPGQLYGEMYALASNKLEPVPAQGYQPLLEQPYDISLQDQLNEVTSASRAAQRLAGGNPAALAMIAANEQSAKSKVLADQFRANQEMKAGVYNRNRQALNQGQLQNLGIYDQQMVRQETAKSRTKEVTQAALSSIADKIQKNKLENRKLGIYENMYNYRFTPSGRIINMNPLYQPNIPNVLPIYDNNGRIVGYSNADDTTTNKNSTYNVKDLTPMDAPEEFIESPIDYDDSSSTMAKRGKKLSKNSNITKAFKGY